MSERFVDRLTLQQIDRDIFTGICHAGSPQRAFGGQVAAQALVAATQTVEDPNRPVHSLHGYFLRAGRPTDPIVYLVDRPRDGRSFSTRLVKAVQYGETIFTMSASFAVPDEGPEHAFDMPDVPGPETLQARPIDLNTATQMREGEQLNGGLLDFRLVGIDESHAPQMGQPQRLAWIKAHDSLPKDAWVQPCALTYFSDLTLVGTALAPHGGRQPNRDLMLASLDHAMWFHRPFRADEWILFVQMTPVARSGRGLAYGLFYTEDGKVVASAVQEVLMRHIRDRSEGQ